MKVTEKVSQNSYWYILVLVFNGKKWHIKVPILEETPTDMIYRY